MKKCKISYFLTILALAFVFIINTRQDVQAAKKTCAYQSCSRTCVEGGRYCSYHTCSVEGCKGLCWSDSVRYCYNHRCAMKDCPSPHASGSRYCSKHQQAGKAADDKRREKYSKNKSSGKSSASKSSSKSKNKGSSSKTKKKYDPYDVHDYKSAQDFADNKYEEFYDYEDDFEDEDEAYDAAEDYWREHH